MQSWEILRADGQYVGRSDAHCAEVAFCQYMIVRGKVLTEGDLISNRGADGAVLIECQDERYILNGT